MAYNSKHPALLVIDSRERNDGGTLDSFMLRLNPAIADIKGVSLLYASIGNPEDNHSELYWNLRIREFGLPVRCAQAGDDSTFIIPVNSAQGFRTIHKAGTDFSHVTVQQPAQEIQLLHVDLGLPGGYRPGLTNDWFCVLGLTYN